VGGGPDRRLRAPRAGVRAPRLEDGRLVGIRYAGTNGGPFRGIVTRLAARVSSRTAAAASGHPPCARVAHARGAGRVLATDERYTFFRLADGGAVGSLGAELTPESLDRDGSAPRAGGNARLPRGALGADGSSSARTRAPRSGARTRISSRPRPRRGGACGPNARARYPLLARAPAEARPRSGRGRRAATPDRRAHEREEPRARVLVQKSPVDHSTRALSSTRFARTRNV
jgi:hypothetical protein